MAQQQQHAPRKSSWKIALYRMAKWTWLITSWIWTAIIIAILVQFVSNLLLSAKPIDTLKNINSILNPAIIHWLSDSNLAFPWNIVRIVAICVIIVLVIVTPIAFLLKHNMQHVQPEGFDKLIDILQQDTIAPQLDRLCEQFDQQLSKQDTLITGLSHAYVLLQQYPTFSHLQYLHTSFQRQLYLQEQLHQTLQNMQITLQTTTSTQSQQLGDLHNQDQQMLKTISTFLQDISFQLKNMSDKLNTASSMVMQDSGPQTTAGLKTLNPAPQQGQTQRPKANSIHNSGDTSC